MHDAVINCDRNYMLATSQFRLQMTLLIKGNFVAFTRPRLQNHFEYFFVAFSYAF